jgi:hypothetical protein
MHPLVSYSDVTTGMSTVHTPATYVTPGNPAQSLVATLTAQGGSMATMAGLTSAESDLIATWIQEGAQQ